MHHAISPLPQLDPPLHIVLVEPRIPPNTGNIARLCACTGVRLHLVGPLGFSIADADLKRAGLDYWSEVHEALYTSLPAFLEAHGAARMFLFSARGTKSYFQARFKPGDFLIFGSETTGLPAEFLSSRPDHVWTVPMVENRRSLNLSTCAGIVTYEALRQVTTIFGEAGPGQ